MVCASGTLSPTSSKPFFAFLSPLLLHGGGLLGGQQLVLILALALLSCVWVALHDHHRLQPPDPESCSTGQPGACFRGGSSPEYTFEYNGASAAAEVFFLRDGVFSLWVAGDFSEWEGLGDCKRGSEGNEPVV